MKKLLQKIDLWIGFITMTLMTLVIVIQVIFRFAGHPLSWPEEVARWMMIWISFAGASYSFRNGGLIQVDFFVKKLFPPVMQKWITILGYLIMGGMFGYIMVSAFRYILMTREKGLTYPMTQLPTMYIILALVVGGFLVVLFCIGRIIEMIKASPEEIEQIEKGGEKE